ncbi:MAG: sulfite exporter TauE/SafE family protein [Alphaproteobacteria bacterium]|nr:sulfite exporter TauE/SafE family protein [Alphaproteobacteria bacterium]
MPEDMLFYAAAVPAVILVGLSKGGLGGAFALMGVPLLAMVMSPVKAAAIMLPILIVMDIASLWVWRHHNDMPTLKTMLPGGVIGVGIGWLTASFVTDAWIRLIVGVIAIVFVTTYIFDRYRSRKHGPPDPAPQRPIKATLWGAVSGFTSFVSHAGGPPYQVYTLPLRLTPKNYTGTSTRYFAVINALKFISYFSLGQFDASVLTASAVLLPLAISATFAGAWVIKRMKPAIFYPLMYTMVTVTAIKLVADGLNALFG